MSSYPSLEDLLGLCKLKVVSLILLTAIVGMLLAVPYFPSLFVIFFASMGISFAAMSAAVFNHVVDEKIDIQMSRTCLLYTSPSPRDQRGSRMPSSA